MIYLIDVKGELEGDYEVLGKASIYEERPKAQWVKETTGVSWHWECSNCHDRPLWSCDYQVLSDFCPHCGADMRTEETTNETDN